MQRNTPFTHESSAPLPINETRTSYGINPVLWNRLRLRRVLVDSPTLVEQVACATTCVEAISVMAIQEGVFAPPGSALHEHILGCDYCHEIVVSMALAAFMAPLSSSGGNHE